MIINTITCHDVYNCGASLQAYALMKYLENRGHHTEIIDYKPNYLSGHYKLLAISDKWSKTIAHKLFYYSIKIPVRIFNLGWIRKNRFDTFKKEYLHLTKERYHNNLELSINPPYAEVYIAGSDQIWNTSYGNGKDPAFYLDFAPLLSIKASYAASFSISEIDDTIKPFVKSQISKFDFVSVRESTGVHILNDMGLSGVQVCDPVFLLNRKQWISITKKRIINDKYILVYDFELNKDLEHFVIQYAQKNKLKIIAIKDGPVLKYADKVLCTVGPIEFLTLIRDCECVVSNSFHGSAFALIFHKEFFVFNRIKQKVNSRMADLLNSLDLSKRLIVESNDVFNVKIDYNKTTELLNLQIANSCKYLEQILK